MDDPLVAAAAQALLPFLSYVDDDFPDEAAGAVLDAIQPFIAGRNNRLSPTIALGNTWKPGERVELVEGGYGGRPVKTRPGTVACIRRIYGYHERLVVKFDDGEERPINPDVMRHIKRKEE